MTAHMVLSCDGTRSGQPCRGAHHSRSASLSCALAEVPTWRLRAVGHALVLRCPSRSHDDEADW